MSNQRKLSSRERIDILLDDSSFVEIGGYVTARNTDFNTQDTENPADGVITGYGVIDERLVYVYSQDADVLGGSVGEMHAKKITKIYDMALKMGAPVIGLVDCAGLRLQEATDALNAFGEIYLKQTKASGVVPQITGIFGACGGGLALLPTLSDITFMTKENAKLFINSPNALEGNHESKLDTAGAAYHAENTVLTDGVFENDETVLAQIRMVIGLLPSNHEDVSNEIECTDDLNRIIPNLESLSEDARGILTQIADNNIFIELKKDYAKDMVIGFIRMNGKTIGCVANQANEGGKELTTKGTYIAAEFVNFLDAFSIPVLSVTNVNGYKATVAEENNIAKAVAKLTYAFANTSSPKVNLVVGEGLGSAYVAMNSKSIGADIEYAWPDTVIGTMNPEMAVKIMYADDKKADIAKETAEYQMLMSSAASAAKRGYVDDIIEPEATRKRLIAAFEMLYTKQDLGPYKKHGAV